MVPRDDLPPMPNDNSDPTLMPYRELFNEGINGGRSKYFPLGQTVNYKNDAFGAGSIGVTIILPFSRKATDKINVIFESAAPVFHCLNAGAPVWIGHPNFPYTVYPGKENYSRVWNTNHTTRNNLSFVLMLPWPNGFVADRSMYCLIDVPSGSHRMWIIAE